MVQAPSAGGARGLVDGHHRGRGVVVMKVVTTHQRHEDQDGERLLVQNLQTASTTRMVEGSS
jgi:hypothetical protein